MHGVLLIDNYNINFHAVNTLEKVCLQRTDNFKCLSALIDHKTNWTQLDPMKKEVTKGIGIMYLAKNIYIYLIYGVGI